MNAFFCIDADDICGEFCASVCVPAIFGYDFVNVIFDSQHPKTAPELMHPWHLPEQAKSCLLVPRRCARFLIPYRKLERLKSPFRSEFFDSVVVRAGGVDIRRAKFCLRALREAVSSSTTCDNLYLRPLSGHDYNIVSL